MARSWLTLSAVLLLALPSQGLVPKQCPNLSLNTCYFSDVATLKPQSANPADYVAIGALFDVRMKGPDAFTCGSDFNLAGLLHTEVSQKCFPLLKWKHIQFFLQTWCVSWSMLCTVAVSPSLARCTHAYQYNFKYKSLWKLGTDFHPVTRYIMMYILLLNNNNINILWYFVQAFLWSVDYWQKRINMSPSISIGGVVFDSCMRTDQLIQNILGFEQVRGGVKDLEIWQKLRL